MRTAALVLFHGLRMVALGGSMGCARLPFVGLWGVTPMGWAEGVRLEDGPCEDLVFQAYVIYLFF